MTIETKYNIGAAIRGTIVTTIIAQCENMCLSQAIKFHLM